jgi:hypothetical protein
VNKLLINFYEKSKYFILFLLVILFPVNQQLHIRPFPNIEGVIVDYLILKISIPEVLLIVLTLFNLNWIIRSLKEHAEVISKYLLLWLIIIGFSILNIFKSNYPLLAFYENLILILILLNSLTLKYFQKINLLYLFSNSIKFWMFTLLILGIFQFYAQESVLGSYYFFGEFTYSSDNYHIKQDGMLIKNLIPAYGIFSHSNIYGAFFLISSMFLHLVKKNSLYLTLIAIGGIFLSGSLNILLGFIFFLIFFYLKINYKILAIYCLFCFLVLNYLSFGFQSYQEDLSIYRRLYMINLSNIKFSEDIFGAITGFGYYNYFKIVSEDLFFYEIIRFFQPPHNVFYLIVWNYGLIFLIAFLILLFKLIKNADKEFKIFFLILILISMFDHFIFTNHQIKMLLFLILPYSINRVLSIKMN